jgi:hypothetical protein
MAVGVTLTRALVTCPCSLPWRSEAALAQRAIGDGESAGRLAAEELELAQALAPRAHSAWRSVPPALLPG